MRQEARIILDIYRRANNGNIHIGHEVANILREVLPLERDEETEIFEILAADLREKNATYPGFENVKRTIDDIKKQRDR